MSAVTHIDLPGIHKFKSGKVREVYDLGDQYLFIASDRISAFDVIMPDGIPNKGQVLNMISKFWFERTGDVVKNHMISYILFGVTMSFPLFLNSLKIN